MEPVFALMPILLEIGGSFRSLSELVAKLFKIAHLQLERLSSFDIRYSLFDIFEH